MIIASITFVRAINSSLNIIFFIVLLSRTFSALLLVSETNSEVSIVQLVLQRHSLLHGWMDRDINIMQEIRTDDKVI